MDIFSYSDMRLMVKGMQVEEKDVGYYMLTMSVNYSMRERGGTL